MSENIHKYGAVLFGQLHHGGNMSSSRLLGGGAIYSASALRREGGPFSLSSEVPKEMEVEVAAIINACGFDLMDVSSLKQYGYGVYPNVVVSMEYERIMCASGPSAGEIIRPSDKKHPHKIGFILCVGSRNVGLKPYCSKICCMYATKEAIMTMEHAPDCEISVFFNDLRTIGKNHDDDRGEQYNRTPGH